MFYYPSGTVLEDVDGWAGATPNYDDGYYWIVGSRRTITSQIRRSMVIRNIPGTLPNPSWKHSPALSAITAAST